MHRPSRSAAALLACLATTSAAGGAALTAPAAAQGAPPLPGPPPGSGSGFPLPPAAGRAPPPSAPGPPAAIPPSVPGPALADGGAEVTSAGRLTLRVACRAAGRASLNVAELGSRTLAQAAYTCRDHRRSTVRMRIPHGDARRLARLGTAVGRVTLQQRGATARVSLALASSGHTMSPGFWSDGGLQCASPGPRQSYLVAPNFTVTPATSIDVRPWIAWYTTDGGWRWLGVQQRGVSRWYPLTATPGGVAQWLQPTGAIDPWTWGPIDVPTGGPVHLMGVVEVVYWYGGRPTYVWKYTHSFLTSEPSESACAYP